MPAAPAVVDSIIDSRLDRQRAFPSDHGLIRPRPRRRPARRVARVPHPTRPALKLERRRRCRTGGSHSGILNPRRRHVVRTTDCRIRRLREPRAWCARHEERGLPYRAGAQAPAGEGADRLQARLLRLGTVPQRGAGVSCPRNPDDRHSAKQDERKEQRRHPHGGRRDGPLLLQAAYRPVRPALG